MLHNYSRGLGLSKPSTPGFGVECLNPLVELNLNELEKRIEEWAFIAIAPL